MNVHVVSPSAAPPTVPPSPETAITLASLGAQLRCAIEAEHQAEKEVPSDVDLDQSAPFMTVYSRCSDLVDQIEKLEPVSFLDFGVKMLAFAWTRGEFWQPEAQKSECTGTRIVDAFVPSILRATGLMPAIDGAPVSSTSAVVWGREESALRIAVRTINNLNADIKRADRFMRVWEKRNPWPNDNEDRERLQRGQGRRASRYQNALRQCRRGALKKRLIDVWAEYNALCERAAALLATTPADIQAKARLAYYEREGGPIHQALFQDLARFSFGAGKLS